MDRPYRTGFASRRLRGFDYASAAGYFITLCVQGRRPMFGTIQAGTVALSALGVIVKEEWQRGARMRPGVELDEFIIMPDHLHAIVILPGLPKPREFRPQYTGLYRRPRSLGSLVAQFKATTTRRIRLLPGNTLGPVWQRNYHDRIIRNLAALDRIRAYIVRNPSQWTPAGPRVG